MRILVITKRQYMNKDLLDDRFGRFRELPLALVKRGHQVQGVCLSYSPRQEGIILDSWGNNSAQITWHSKTIGRLKVPGMVRFIKETVKITKNFKPDIIWATSDSIYGILGFWVAHYTNTRCVFDLYDNYESFASSRIPGILPLYSRAVRESDGLTCISEPLQERVFEKYNRTKPTLTLVNAVRKDIFYPRNKLICREQLGLPKNKKVIGTAGAIDNSRGISTLFEAFQYLVSEGEEIHLAIAGHCNRNIQLPSGPLVHYFGTIPLEEVPVLINSLDLGVICNRDSLFGRFCFPQKTYEILTCGVPLVAASIGTLKKKFKNHPECLFIWNNPRDLARAIKNQFDNPILPNIQVPSWDDLGEQLEMFFFRILEGNF